MVVRVSVDQKSDVKYFWVIEVNCLIGFGYD